MLHILTSQRPLPQDPRTITSATEGFRPLPPGVRDGNVLAVVAAQLVRLVVLELLGSASLENPLRSYLWLFYAVLEMLLDLPMKEIVFHQCRFGTPWRKPTKVIFYGDFTPFSLNLLCTKRRG